MTLVLLGLNFTKMLSISSFTKYHVFEIQTLMLVTGSSSSFIFTAT